MISGIYLKPFKIHNNNKEYIIVEGLSSSTSGKESTCQCRRKETGVWSLGQEDPLEKGMTTHSSICIWRIPWTEEPGELQFIGSQSQTGLKWLSTQAHVTIESKTSFLMIDHWQISSPIFSSSLLFFALSKQADNIYTHSVFWSQQEF